MPRGQGEVEWWIQQLLVHECPRKGPCWDCQALDNIDNLVRKMLFDEVQYPEHMRRVKKARAWTAAAS